MNSFVKKGLILFSICLNLAFVVVTVFTYFKGPPFKPGIGEEYPRKVRKMVRRMELVPGLEKEVMDLLDRHRNEIADLHHQNRGKILLMLTLMQQEEPIPPGKLEPLLDEMADLGRKRVEMVLGHMLEVRKLLPPDKRKELFSKVIDKVNRTQFKRRKHPL
ncbi:MAG: periplasmic heavy metal sensor [Desulfobacterales bacterium]|nr:periplasmic heavy metal sensor [Desulfobacterales bacterium]